MINPSQIDPSRTGFLRQRFISELVSRFQVVRRNLVQLIGVDDVLGLQERKPLFNTWRYLNEEQKLQQFKQWMKGQVNATILRKATSSDALLEQYIQAAYMKGADRSFKDSQGKPAKGKEDFFTGGRAQFLRGSFTSPPNIARVRLLASRAYTDLAGITDAMSQQITGILVDGMVRGLGPKQVASALANRVDKIGITRARALARNETIRAHAEGVLDGLESLGVDKVGVAVELDTAADYKVCQKCLRLRGIVLSIQEARGIFPVHGNCRCTPIPANVGEKTTGQIRSQQRIRAAIKASGIKGVRIAKRRPKGLLR